jgi:hypothetical protein
MVQPLLLVPAGEEINMNIARIMFATYMLAFGVAIIAYSAGGDSKEASSDLAAVHAER